MKKPQSEEPQVFSNLTGSLSLWMQSPGSYFGYENESFKKEREKENIKSGDRHSKLSKDFPTSWRLLASEAILSCLLPRMSDS